MKKKKKIYIKILIFIVIAYFAFVLINQQKILNQYAESSSQLKIQIASQEKEKQELIKKQENVGSLEFIEQTAREKLEMYLPNERVYLDKGN